MSTMLLKEVTVTDMVTGEEVPSQIMVCPECFCETFIVHVVDYQSLHMHMQCTACTFNVCGGIPGMSPEEVRRLH